MDEARKALPTPRASINRHRRCVMTESNSTQAFISSESKTCTKCRVEKDCTRDNFSVSKTGRLGFASCCKTCQRAAYRSSAAHDPERFRAYARQSYAKNSDRILAKVKHRRGSDTTYALRLRVSSLVRQSLSKGRLGTTLIKLLEFSAEDLRSRMESLFTDGMTWEDFLLGEIEIDHIIPVSFFNPSDPKSLEFRMCWSLKNLQPLWRVDNRVKGNSLPENFTELWNVLYQEAVK